MIARSQKTSQEKQKRRTTTRLLVTKTRTLKVVLVCVVVCIVFGNYKIAQNQYWEEGTLRQNLEDSRAVTTFKKETNLSNATNVENDIKHTSAGNTNSTHHPPDGISNQPPTMHLVFSTACSLSHDWQSYLFFFQAMYHGQKGDVTRIVSGCSPQEELQMKKLHHQQISIMSPHFKVHFTPEYGKPFDKVSYQQTKYWNKPFGLQHWMEHRFGYRWDDENDDDLSNITVPEYDNHIIVLVDPDMLLQRPFANDFSNVPLNHWNTYYRQHPEQLIGKVSHGHPVAQDYSFGNLWIDKVRSHLNEIVGVDSPVQNLTAAEEEFVFSAGPPYLMTARDAYRISHYLTKFLPKLYKYHSQFMAEMYVYCMAVAHLGLRNQISWGMMISNVQVTAGEGWAFLSKNDTRACDVHKYADTVPNVIHFCQRFSIGEYFINKYLFLKDILSCHHPLMELPPLDILETTWHSSFGDSSVIHYERHDIKRYRNAFVICSLFRAINAMATYYKDHHCDRNVANYETSYNHFRSEQGQKLLCESSESFWSFPSFLCPLV